MKIQRALKFAVYGTRLSHALAIMRDLIGHDSTVHSPEKHLEEMVEWLCRAQDMGNGGVSLGYSLLEGWLDPYPETTGYIIPTFYDMANRIGRNDLRERARRLTKWEISVQMPDGAVQAGAYNSARKQSPAVFNTGQVMFGWLRAYQEDGDKEALEAAKRAGNWLVKHQDPDGCWRKLLSKETTTVEQVYNIRCAWALLELYLATGGQIWADAARKNLAWTLKQQTGNGWFRNNTFFPQWNPLTHNIGYVMEGLLGCSEILNDEKAFSAAHKTAAKLLEIFERDNVMQGDFNKNWQPQKGVRPYTCLTGNAQIAGIWLKLYQRDQNIKWFTGASKLLDVVRRSQSLDSSNQGIKGGVGGSDPIFGFYTPLIYINWGAKFAIDAMAAEIDAAKGIKKAA